MGACSSYLYKLLQGLAVQACVVLQELELLQQELVLKVGLCLLFQQLGKRYPGTSSRVQLICWLCMVSRGMLLPCCCRSLLST